MYYMALCGKQQGHYMKYVMKVAINICTKLSRCELNTVVLSTK